MHCKPTQVVGKNGNENVYQRSADYAAKALTEITLRGRNFVTHKEAASALTTVVNGLPAELLDYISISQNIVARDVRNNLGSLSGHAFGIAFDVNSNKFPQGQGGYDAYINAVNDPGNANHKYALVVKAFVDSGLFNWGGNFRSTKDAHHVIAKPYNL